MRNGASSKPLTNHPICVKCNSLMERETPFESTDPVIVYVCTACGHRLTHVREEEGS